MTDLSKPDLPPEDPYRAALATIRAMPVKTADDLEFLTKLTREVKRQAKDLEAKEKSATAPINDSLKTIRGWFRPLRDLLDETEAALKSRIAEYHRLAEQERQTALAAAVALVEARAPEQETRAALVAIPERAQAAGSSVRKVWKWEVLSGAVVPRDYCSPDSSLISGAVGAGVREIPGVRIWEDLQVIVRAK